MTRGRAPGYPEGTRTPSGPVSRNGVGSQAKLSSASDTLAQAVTNESQLDELLAGYPKLMIAFSGGVDSSYLAYRAVKVLGRDRLLAVLADSPSLARSGYESAVAFAEQHGIPLKIIQTQELEDPRYQANKGDRCYFCKSELFQVMDLKAKEWGFSHLAYGAITDDLGDHRPGARAAAEFSVVAPLQLAGLSKVMIREFSRKAQLVTSEQPSSPCLSSRIAYGESVTREKLSAVEQAEALLKSAGFEECRVRHHGQVARLELPSRQLQEFISLAGREELVANIKACGFLFVSLDLEGLRSGSLNTMLRVIS